MKRKGGADQVLIRPTAALRQRTKQQHVISRHDAKSKEEKGPLELDGGSPRVRATGIVQRGVRETLFRKHAGRTSLESCAGVSLRPSVESKWSTRGMG